MRYALNLGEDGRILSTTFEKYAAQGQPLVQTLPHGSVADYLYVNGEYIFDPLPELEAETVVTISVDELTVLQEKAAAHDILMKGAITE